MNEQQQILEAKKDELVGLLTARIMGNLMFRVADEPKRLAEYLKKIEEEHLSSRLWAKVKDAFAQVEEEFYQEIQLKAAGVRRRFE